MQPSVLEVLRVAPVPDAPDALRSRSERTDGEQRATSLVALRRAPPQLHPRHGGPPWPSLGRRRHTRACHTANMPARVAWISLAPVKGLALAQVEEVLVEPFGVRDNRRFHLIGEDGRLLNGK